MEDERLDDGGKCCLAHNKEGGLGSRHVLKTRRRQKLGMKHIAKHFKIPDPRGPRAKGGTRPPSYWGPPCPLEERLEWL